jgi:hypothetical protein
VKPIVTYVFFAVLIVLFVLLALSYSGALDKAQPRATPTGADGSVLATRRPQASYTPRPTQTPLPTYTHYPTYTPYPTTTLAPTHTAEPTPSIGTRERPAAVGDVLTVTLDETRYEVSVAEIVSGAEAARRVAAANRYNALPGEGQEHLLFRAVVRILAVPGGGKVNLTEFSFSLVDGEGRVWNPPSVVDPEPQFQGSGFAGATVEGWGTHQRRVDEAVYLVFEMNWDGSQGVWFAVPK